MSKVTPGALAYFIQDAVAETREIAREAGLEERKKVSEERNALYDEQIKKTKMTFWDFAKVGLQVALNFVPLGGQMMELGKTAMKFLNASVQAAKLGLGVADQAKATRKQKEQLEFQRDLENVQDNPLLEEYAALEQASRNAMANVRS
ncbi:MAG: hypothetical protein AAFZ18_11295 [Myxococcota bacterium]